MDLIGAALTVTFVAMLSAGAMLVRVRRPPFHRQQIRCPQDHAAATVVLTWEPQPRRMTMVECDHRLAKEGRCQKACEASLQNAFPELTATTITP